jgi:hypothetical protein
VPDDDHRGARPGRHVGQRRQHAPHVLVPVGVDLTGQERHQRVDDDQGGALALDQVLEQEQVGGQLRRPGRDTSGWTSGRTQHLLS